MPRNEPRSDEDLAALHSSEGLTEAFAEATASLPRGWWLATIEIKTDVYNPIFDANSRWHVEAFGVGGSLGVEESAEGATLPEALRNLAATMRETWAEAEPWDPSVPDVFQALDFYVGRNEAGITAQQASDVLDREGGWYPLRGRLPKGK